MLNLIQNYQFFPTHVPSGLLPARYRNRYLKTSWHGWSSQDAVPRKEPRPGSASTSVHILKYRCVFLIYKIYLILDVNPLVQAISSSNSKTPLPPLQSLQNVALVVPDATTQETGAGIDDGRIVDRSAGPLPYPPACE